MVKHMSKPYHVFIVEDDASLRSMLCDYLEKQNLAVTAMASAEDMLRRIERLRPDLIVLDVSLPGMSGLQACQKLRGDGDRVPIIILTARSEEVDRVLGLEMGADDFLGKPFSARELLARIHAVLRRAIVLPGLPQAASAPVAMGDAVLDMGARCLRRGDLTRVLSTVEFSILAELVGNPGVVVSRERLLAVSHVRSESVLLRAVDVAVMRLRKLVEPDPALPRYIQTVRGQGYIFVPDHPAALAARAAAQRLENQSRLTDTV
ncbi:MAG: Two-component system response regulator [Rhizobacter sp.]|nr:Two-component system response regulator [Rhizobacter sp.]